MRLAQTYASIDEQRIVRVARILRHRQRSRIGEIVAVAHHEIIKCVFRVQHRAAYRVHLALHFILRMKFQLIASAKTDAHQIVQIREIPVLYVVDVEGIAAGDDQRILRDGIQLQRADPLFVGYAAQIVLQVFTYLFPSVLLLLRVIHGGSPSIGF